MDGGIFDLLNTPPGSPKPKAATASKKKAKSPTKKKTSPYKPTYETTMDDIDQATNLANATIKRQKQKTSKPSSRVNTPVNNAYPQSLPPQALPPQSLPPQPPLTQAPIDPYNVYPPPSEAPKPHQLFFNKLESFSHKAPSIRLMEQKLYAQVLNKPMFQTPKILQDGFGIAQDAFTYNTLMHLLEISLSIATIVLSANSINNDTSTIHNKIWNFLIASSGILLAISLLFLFKIMNFERNSGIFYCLIGSCLSLSSMGVAIGIVLPVPCDYDGYESNSMSQQCRIRKAETALVCVAAMIWYINLLQFLTVYVISRLSKIKLNFQEYDDIDDINNEKIDFENEIFNNDTNTKRHSDHTLINEKINDPTKLPAINYTLGPDMALYRITDNSQVKGMKKINLYK